MRPARHILNRRSAAAIRLTDNLAAAAEAANRAWRADQAAGRDALLLAKSPPRQRVRISRPARAWSQEAVVAAAAAPIAAADTTVVAAGNTTCL